MRELTIGIELKTENVKNINCFMELLYESELHISKMEVLEAYAGNFEAIKSKLKMGQARIRND